VLATASSGSWPAERILTRKGETKALWSEDQFRRRWMKSRWPELLRAQAFRDALNAVNEIREEAVQTERLRYGEKCFVSRWTSALEVVAFWSHSNDRSSPEVLDHALAIAVRCCEMDWPYWSLSAEAALFISLIDAPKDLAYLPDHLPFSGLILEVPEEANLFMPHPSGGQPARVEAILLAQNDVVSDQEEHVKEEVKKAPGMGGRLMMLNCVAVGGFRGYTGRGRDDCLAWFTLVNREDEMPPEAGPKVPDHTVRLRAFVRSFLMVHAARYFRTTTCDPLTALGPKRREKAQKRGVQRTTMVNLGEGVLRPAPKSENVGSGESTVAAHWVRGHWHSYWVKDVERARERRAGHPGDVLVIDQETRGQDQWFKVAYLILPYRKGEGDVVPHLTQVRL
jgi:hypothetical protein